VSRIKRAVGSKGEMNVMFVVYKEGDNRYFTEKPYESTEILL
jgi:hypothetical protein